MGYISDQLSVYWSRFPGPYVTPKSVYVYDTRLRYSQVIAFAVIVGLVIIELLLLHRDSLFEVPQGNVNAWSTFADLPPETMTVLPSYCNNPTYDWRPTGQDLLYASGFSAGNVSCPALNAGSYIQLTDTGINARTFGFRQFVNYTCLNDSTALCDPRASEVTSFFYRRVHDIPLSFIHSYTTSWGEKGTNAHLRVFDSTGKLKYDIPKGNPLSGLTVKDYLDLAGVSLDQQNLLGFLQNISDPYYRMTGIVLIVKLKYSNKRSFDVDQSMRADMTVEAVEGAWGYVGANVAWLDFPRYQMREDSCAVAIRFVIEGSVGVFDYFTLILQIMAAAFLINVAQHVVDFVGMYLIGDREAFAAAKYGTLELNRRRTGHRHDETTRAKTLEANREMIRNASMFADVHDATHIARAKSVAPAAQEDQVIELATVSSNRPGEPNGDFAPPSPTKRVPSSNPNGSVAPMTSGRRHDSGGGGEQQPLLSASPLPLPGTVDSSTQESESTPTISSDVAPAPSSSAANQSAGPANPLLPLLEFGENASPERYSIHMESAHESHPTDADSTVVSTKVTFL